MLLFEKIEDFPLLRWAEGFLIGAMTIIAVAMLMPKQVQVVKVPEVKVIEKPVIVKKPVYLSKHDKQQIACMAENGYYEAGNQSTKGIIAVNNVVMNRVEDKRFPKTPCGVINQKAKGVCQFSWKCEGHKKIRDYALYQKAKKIAEDVYLGNYGDVTKGAQFYHATYVRPHWSNVFDRTTRIGAHVFYEG